ncbi:hypothetical protein CANARDRAFT_10477 [[Candida] arabinofermentans NRRL YB-2248]|uniref:DNA polymerase n=1 Tax=[Candida] arabinofermentans NRRL YB-2248 TaxID=983967 RepID=A0A1E4SSX5_9ASCO|nr:hypothetical protein CANARDRAFT_10477 [[Candida] arabinofermentans NRRL YB-2248]
MLKHFNLVVIPRLNSRLENTRLDLWKANGAKVWFGFQSLYASKKDLPTNSKTIVVINDPKLKPSVFRKATFDQDGNCLFDQKTTPVVSVDWLISSLKSDQLKPTDEFKFELRPSFLQPSKKQLKNVSNLKRKAEDDDNDDVSSISKTERLAKRLTVNNRSQGSDRVGKGTTNIEIIKIFEDLIQIYESLQLFDNKNAFKVNNYRLALKAIERYNKPIKSSTDLKSLSKGSITSHIDEIIKTGTFEKYEILKKQTSKNEMMNLMTKFNKIHGFSNKSSYKLIKAGITKIEDISFNEIYSSLNKQQKLGIKYYEDWLKKIPRAEVSQHVDLITNEARKLDPNLKVDIMGSYLRGNSTCGDIDFMLYKENLDDPAELHDLLYKLVRQLIQVGYIECELNEVSPTMHKFNGGSRLPPGDSYNYCRRIDIISVPYKELGAARIYFVGNDIFNRTIRLLASMKGYHLSDKGLFKVNADESHTLLESFDERKIFQLLEVEFVEYSNRNI